MVPIQAPKCGDFMGVKGNIQGTGGLGRLARRLRPLAPPVPLRPLERPILGAGDFCQAGHILAPQFRDADHVKREDVAEYVVLMAEEMDLALRELAVKVE